MEIGKYDFLNNIGLGIIKNKFIVYFIYMYYLKYIFIFIRLNNIGLDIVDKWINSLFYMLFEYIFIFVYYMYIFCFIYRYVYFFEKYKFLWYFFGCIVWWR